MKTAVLIAKKVDRKIVWSGTDGSDNEGERNGNRKSGVAALPRTLKGSLPGGNLSRLVGITVFEYSFYTSRTIMCLFN